MGKKSVAQIILHDGTVYEGGTCGYADEYLWCTIPNVALLDIVDKFTDSNATQEITFKYGGEVDKYEGFVNITYIMKDGEKWKVSLHK